jgi:hypothetical protein
LQVRQEAAYFALKLFNAALNLVEISLGMSPAEDATKAKILNNIGIIYYYQYVKIIPTH